MCVSFMYEQTRSEKKDPNYKGCPHWGLQVPQYLPPLRRRKFILDWEMGVVELPVKFLTPRTTDGKWVIGASFRWG